MTARKGSFMQRYSGGVYWPLDPRMNEVALIDIAHSLSMQCRFTGHARTFYSVAEHSVHVSHCVPEELALVALLHDATEAYVTDVASPVKRHLENYADLEALNWAVIAEKFDLPRQLPEEVHVADQAMLMREREVLLPTVPGLSAAAWYGAESAPAPANRQLFCWTPAEAKQQFIARFFEVCPLFYKDAE